MKSAEFDGDYDVIILGTGLKECILSGLLSVGGKKVLHMDRNDYYGAESASLNLTQLYKKFKPEQAPDEAKLGRARDYNVDQCPKFIMANGNLVKMLLKTQVTRYLEFKSVDGSYVFKKGKLHEVPMTAQAALKSGLMGMMQKRRYKNFLEWVMNIDPDKPASWNDKGGMFSKGAELDLRKLTMQEIFAYWKIGDDTQEFTGHAVALHTNDDYMKDVAQTLPTLMNMQLYATSLARYGTSPYIYPCWGLGGLPEGFSRLCAVHGGVYMLRRPISSILYNDDGSIRGVCSPDPEDEEKQEEAYCKQLICDPTYFADTEKVKKVGQIAQWLCILGDRPVGIKGGDSAQVIIPGNVLGRVNDVYISIQGWGLQCAPQNRYIAMISSNVEGGNPRAELEPALKALGQPPLEEFFFVRDVYMPTNRDVPDNIFISQSMDATTNFQALSAEVLAMYKQITGEDVDLTAKPDAINQDS